MPESELYINFLKRNFVYFFLPFFIGFVTAVYLYSTEPTKQNISQTYKLLYDSENIEARSLLADQAVSELRAQKFAEVFEDASVNIYKASPLNISIEVSSSSRETSYALLLKETEYLRQNFEVSELTNPEIAVGEPSWFRYLVSGAIIGGLFGLIISLIREYLRNY